MKISLQLGERDRIKKGSNISPEMMEQQEVRDVKEQVDTLHRRIDNLHSYADGKLSPLAVTYGDIVADVSILDRMLPLNPEPDMDGKLLLWEGWQKPAASIWSTGDRTRGKLCRVLQTAEGYRVFCFLKERTWEKFPESGGFPELVTGGFGASHWPKMLPNTVQQVTLNRQGQTMIRTRKER